MRYKILLVLYFSLFPLFLKGQENPDSSNKPNKDSSNVASSEAKDGRSFRGVKLLSSYDDVLVTLKKDSLILVKPESDFQDFDEDPPTWIVASLPPLMDHLYYHFFDKKLYIISIFFNPKKTSYAELYQILKKNYGTPTETDSSQSQWKLPNNTLIVLDTLPSLKYIDESVFEAMKTKEGQKLTLKSLEEQEKALEATILDDL